jgi:hypothetical protein
MPIQVDAEFTKWLLTLGVGGVLAGLMFMFYRKDIKQYTELWKLATDQMMLIVKENTASNSKLIALIENQERNAIRKSDIESLIARSIIKNENLLRDEREAGKT